MTLLETLQRAAAVGGDGASSAPCRFPLALNAVDALRKMTPEGEDPTLPSPVTRLVGWQIPPAEAEGIDSLQKLAKKLRRKLKNLRSVGREEFLALLGSLPAEKLGDVTGGEVVGLMAQGCVALELWEPLGFLILHGHVGRLGSNDLVEKLVEKGRAELLCLYVERVPNPRASELLAILGYFLSPTRGSREGMLKVRKEWESQALLAIEKATQKGVPEKVATLARDASVLLMMAHDGFSTSELCLHSLFSSPNMDGLVMASAVSRLGGSELMGLIRYLRKWLEKYERFPEACPCPEAGTVLGLKGCELVPSLESLVKGLGLIIDEHYSYLVLNSQFHEEMRSIWRLVNSLASTANLCCSVANIIDNLRSM